MSILIIGELINTSRKKVREAVETKDSEYIKELARKQAESGADYIDVNCGTVIDNEPETMQWMVEHVQSVVDIPLCLDSPDPKTLERGLSSLKNDKQPMINSISAEKERYQLVLPLVLKYKTKIVSLCMDDNGMPETITERLWVAEVLINDMEKQGVSQGDIYLDPFVKPISTNDKAGMEALDTITEIKRNYPEVHGICGLSNVSLGLPNRKILNQIFMAQTMARGMDSYILDPLDKQMMGCVCGSKALLGLDEYSMEYLTADRQGLFGL